MKKVLKKREYDYDDENRITNFIEYDPNSDTTLIPSEKTTTTWFDDDYFSERIEYSYNGSDWDPVTRKLSPDLGHPDNFTTFNFEWNSIGANWDTVSKTISYLNGANKVIEMYNYVIIQGVWLIIEMITIDYTNDGDLILVNEYHTGDNGGSYELERYTEYVYTSEGLLYIRKNRWDLEYGWYYSDVWHWDDFDRLLQYSYVTYTPLHPEPQGGIVYRYYYDEQSLIHHRNVYSSYSQNHISTDFYYYSDFTIDIDEIDIPNIICYPNPLSTSTTFEYTLQHPSSVQIIIYNQLGEQVEVIRQRKIQESSKSFGMLRGYHRVYITTEFKLVNGWLRGRWFW